MNEMMDSIYSLFINELDFIREHSYFASQSMRNQDECGELVELAIRKFLKEIIGDRLKITHGYIYSSENKQLSPQIDIIITDRLVPHKLKKFEYLDNLEIVPVESVVAVFEVKRTLNTSTLKKAGEHLEKIFDSVALSKTNTQCYSHGGFTINHGGGLLSNPLIGIIGLLHEGTIERSVQDLPWFIDTIFSFQSSTNQLYGALIVPQDIKGIPHLPNISGLRHRFDNSKIQYVAFHHKRIKILQNFIAYLIHYLNGTGGRIFDVNSCFNLHSDKTDS